MDTGLCGSVKSRFPAMMAMLDPKYVAEKIIEAHRSDTVNLSLPPYMLYLNDWMRLLPVSCNNLFFDYMNCGIGGKQ